jgi:cullin-associated NEDD8-dissociated protein 1
MPTQQEVEEELRIGAPPPEHFDTGMYSICLTKICNESNVQIWTQGTQHSPIFDQEAIFAIFVNGTRRRFLANKRSTVTISSSSFSFRNPPMFMALVDPRAHDALYETEALLDHLFYHPNVAPFVAKSLIQRFVTSNPSPRYIEQVAIAFSKGSYNGRDFSLRYGDLGAAVAATLLDSEARSLVLAADPNHGQVREPLLRILHFLRTMEFEPRNDREVELNRDLILKIGQGVYRSPTVFSFFRLDYSPKGPISSAGLFSPEAQLGILPYIIGECSRK